jgi:hypothetical protein
MREQLYKIKEHLDSRIGKGKGVREVVANDTRG